MLEKHNHEREYNAKKIKNQVTKPSLISLICCNEMLLIIKIAHFSCNKQTAWFKLDFTDLIICILSHLLKF